MKKLAFSPLIRRFIYTYFHGSDTQLQFRELDQYGRLLQPYQWGTLNNTTAVASVFTAEKGSPGYAGSFYLKLTTKKVNNIPINGIAVSGKFDSINKKPISGFAYNNRPQNFIGRWQFMTYGSSPGGVTATLTKWNSGGNKRDTIAIAKEPCQVWYIHGFRFLYLLFTQAEIILIVALFFSEQVD